MIWLLEIPTGVSEAELQGLLPLLDPERRRKLSEFRAEGSRVESMLAGALLRYAYEKEYGGIMPEILLGEHGKPRFAVSDAPRFNLSHCRKAICCALSGFSVGVDVQPLHRYDGKFRRILSEEERAWIEAADSDHRFTELWTRKEAYGKALGVGLGYALSNTALFGGFSQGTDYQDWKIRTVPKDGYFLSVCAKEDLELQTSSIEALQTEEREET